ncbi:MAG: hypothetical protein JW955_03050 [Sedimentisphaerales bacterium]|nr:hypothetical protein [Sedimentisphaerales bacterium]
MQALFLRLAAQIEPVLAESQRVLLGQRAAGDPTCITQQLEDNRVLLQGSPNGGAGLRIIAFHADSPSAPLALYSWSQEKLRPFLQAEREANTSALAGAEELMAAARELAAGIHQNPHALAGGDTGEWLTSAAWPAECLRGLRTAVRAGDASSVEAWGDELAAATFALADLHRWLNVVLDSHLTSLGFQACCRTAFAYADSISGGTQATWDSSLPAAGLMIAWGENYLEVEHQAEGLFTPVDMAATAVTSHGVSGTPSARWMPPEVRQVFLRLRARLSPAVQAAWDRAASSPLDRSYLANMLYRAMTARSLEQMAMVLHRFGLSHPVVTQAELMDVLFYRSGFNSSGFHWADRYDHRLLDAAGSITGDQELVARRAHELTNSLLKGWENYDGGTMTLTQALDAGKLDCVRGTDMIGALYRNAGHGEYAVVRLRCGSVGHSVGAIPIDRDGTRHLLILDALNPSPPGETWPSAYFNDIAWPEDYPGERGPLFSAELYVRGLDGYLFAEGYVVQGEHAGQSVRAALPYLNGYEEAGSAKIFNGPYPTTRASTPFPPSTGG